MRIIVVALLLCAFRLQAAGGTNEVKLAVGQTYSLSLDSNPTTGYHWRWASPTNEVFVLVTNDYEAAENKERLAGSGGVEHWTFKATAKGRAELVLEYARPWEKTAIDKTNVVIICE